MIMLLNLFGLSFIIIHQDLYLLFSPGSQSSQHIADCFFIAQAPSHRIFLKIHVLEF